MIIRCGNCVINRHKRQPNIKDDIIVSVFHSPYIEEITAAEYNTSAIRERDGEETSQEARVYGTTCQMY